MRKIYMAGMSHKVAEIAVREKFYIPMDVKTEALGHSPFDELLILATCNRTEVYVASDREIAEAELVQYVCKLAGQRFEDFAKFFYFKAGDDVAHHVMNVCAGLDSVAVGEDQILHQIGRAYETAHSLHATGNSLNKFRRKLIRKYVQEYTTNIFASSRTFANAEKFADVLTPVKLEDRYKVLGKCDVVVLCSICQEPLVTKDEFEKVTELVGEPAEPAEVTGRRKRLIIDLGSPRNAEASVGELPGVQYVCVDDLEKIVSENRRLRMVELEAAQKILKEGLDEFLQWYRMDEVSKDIRVHADRMVAVANGESEKLLRSMPDLPENDRERIRMMYERFAKKMANDYLYKVKAGNSPENVKIFLKCLDQSDKRHSALDAESLGGEN